MPLLLIGNYLLISQNNNLTEINFDKKGNVISLLPIKIDKNHRFMVNCENIKVVNESVKIFNLYKKLAFETLSNDFDRRSVLKSTDTIIKKFRKELCSLLNQSDLKYQYLTSNEITQINNVLKLENKLNIDAILPKIEDVGHVPIMIKTTLHYSKGKITTHEFKSGDTISFKTTEELNKLELELFQKNPIKALLESIKYTDSSKDVFVSLKKYQDSISKVEINDALQKAVSNKLKYFKIDLDKYFFLALIQEFGDITTTALEEKNEILRNDIITKITKLISDKLHLIKQDSLLNQYLISGSANFKAENCNNLDCYRQKIEQNTIAIMVKKKELDGLQARLKAQKENIKKNEEIITNIKSDSYERLRFNKIVLVYSNKNTTNYMTHINAADDYNLNGVNCKKEITENESMTILVHNNYDISKLKFNYNITQITDDKSRTEVATGIENGFIAPQAVSLTDKLFNSFYYSINIDSLMRLKKHYDYTKKINFIETKPKLESKLLKTKATSVNVPYTVEYNIPLLKKDGTDSTNVFPSNLKYRVNKIYHVRFKAGLFYSGLRNNKYTLENNLITGKTNNEYGVDASFGIQWFPLGTDIRSYNLYKKGSNTCPWFLYFGTPIIKAPLSNMLIGTGLELHPGIAIMTGIHIGNTQKIVNNAGKLSINEKSYTTGLFGSVAFDLAVFNRIFNYSNIENPFKRN